MKSPTKRKNVDGDVFRTLELSDAELVEILTYRASSNASERAEKRLNFMLTVLLAVLGVLVAGAAVLIEGRVRATVQAEVDSRLPAALASASLIPLLASGTQSLRDPNSQIYASMPDILEALEMVTPDLLQLEGVQRRMAFNEVEAVVDVLWGRGDYHNTLDILNNFDGALLEDEGAYFTYGMVAASLLAIEGAASAQFVSLVGALDSQVKAPDHLGHASDRALDFVREVAEADWDEATAIARAQYHENADEIDFGRVLTSML